MFGMNEQDTSFFWLAIIIATYFAATRAFDTINEIRVARWRAERARWDSVDRVQVVKTVDPVDQTDEKEEVE